MDRFADLDELVVGCRTDAARGYISEAVMAYRAGALRASVAATWVAVVFDLIDKIRELAISGSAEAKSEVARLEEIQAGLDEGEESAIKRSLSFERSILETVKNKYELLDYQQYTDLVRLREDRHRCAHPTYQHTGQPYRPSAESVRAHLRNAFTHVLHLAPVQGRAAIAEVVQRVSSEYFPAERDDACESLKESPLARPTPALVRGVVDALVFGFFDEDGDLHHKKRAAYALGAVVELHRVDALPRAVQQADRLALKVDDAELRSLVGLLGAVPEVWGDLGSAAQRRIESFLRTGPSGDFSKCAHYALLVPGLAEVARSRIALLDRRELTGLMKRGVTDEVVERAVELYASAGSFDAANLIADNLMLPLLPNLNAEHVERIIRSPSEEGSDLPGSFGFDKFLDRARKDGPIPADALDQLLHDAGLGGYTKGEEADDGGGDEPGENAVAES